MGCGVSSARGTISSGMFGQRSIMSPELRQDAHEELGVTLVACSIKGRRKTQEDTSSIVINLGGKKDMLGVGVFDGHSGPQASRFVAAHLWEEVTKTSAWAAGNVDGALKAAFLAVDEKMRREKVLHGTTAVVAVITPDYLYVANCGDSRAVLCKGGVGSAMSTDHKPGVFTEMARVLRCGGQVMAGEYGGVARVTAPGAMVAMATSRSLGDFHFKRGYNSEPWEQVVSPAAEVTCQRRTVEDEFLVLGTDGVWDVLSNQEVSNMLRAAERSRKPRPGDPPMTASANWETPGSGEGAVAPTAGTDNAIGAPTTPSTETVSSAMTYPVELPEGQQAAATSIPASDGRSRRSLSGARGRPPAFIRLITPNLVRLITPTSPERSRARAARTRSRGALRGVGGVHVEAAGDRGEQHGAEQEQEEKQEQKQEQMEPAKSGSGAAAEDGGVVIASVTSEVSTTDLAEGDSFVGRPEGGRVGIASAPPEASTTAPVEGDSFVGGLEGGGVGIASAPPEAPSTAPVERDSVVGGMERGVAGIASATPEASTTAPVEGDSVVGGLADDDDRAADSDTVVASVRGEVSVNGGDLGVTGTGHQELVSEMVKNDVESDATVGERQAGRDLAGVGSSVEIWRRVGKGELVNMSSSLSDSCSSSDCDSDSESDSESGGSYRSSSISSDSDSYFDGSEFGGGMTAIEGFLSLQRRGDYGKQMSATATEEAASPGKTSNKILKLSVGSCLGADVVRPSSGASVHSPLQTSSESEGEDNSCIAVPRSELGSAPGQAQAQAMTPAPAPATPVPATSCVDGNSGGTEECNESQGLIDNEGIEQSASEAAAVKDISEDACLAAGRGSGQQAKSHEEAGSSMNEIGREEDGCGGIGDASAEPGESLGASPSRPPRPTEPQEPQEPLSSTPGAAAATYNSSAGVTATDDTPNSGNNPWNTPLRYIKTPGGSANSNSNNGCTPKTPNLRASPPIYRSFRAANPMTTPGGRVFSNGGTPSSRGVRLGSGGGNGSSRGSFRRSGSSGGLFQRSSGSSLSLPMTAKESKGVIGAVRGVLDRALHLGSQDNMTIIAIDLRGFMEPSPPPSTSSMQ